MVTAPFLQMGKLLPEHSATSTLDHLRYITYGIFWRVFDKQMHMIRVYCHINDLTYGLLRFFQYLNDTNQYEFEWMVAGSVPAGVAQDNRIRFEK